MRIATRAAAAVFAAAAMGAVMAPSAGAATSAPAAGSQISAVNEGHECYTKRHIHYIHHICRSDWYEGYRDERFGHDEFGGDDHGHDGGHDHP